MADGVKISLLPGAGTISDDDVVAGVQAGRTKKFSFARIFAWLKAKLTPGEIGAQAEITASGILMGDGAGGVTAAQAGTDYATPSQIPTVPSASTANPQMDGAASPGNTGEWADGGHVHPTDTSRVPTSRTINGYDLTQDRSLTAADVGAAPAKTVLRFTSVAVSAGASQQIISISNADITADHVLARIEWANPSYITTGYTWTTGAGSFTLSGTCTAAATANVVLIRKGN